MAGHPLVSSSLSSADGGGSHSRQRWAVPDGSGQSVPLLSRHQKNCERVISCMAKWMDFRNTLEQTSFDPSPATRTIFYPIYHNISNPSAEITWCLRNVLMISLIFWSFTRHQCGIVVLLGILQDRSGLELS